MSEAPQGQKLGVANVLCPAWHVQRVSTDDVEPTMVLDTFKVPVHFELSSGVMLSKGKFKLKEEMQVDIIMHRLSPDVEAGAFAGQTMKRNVALTRRNGDFEETIKALTKQVQSEAMAKKKAGAATGKDEIHKKWVKECKHLLT